MLKKAFFATAALLIATPGFAADLPARTYTKAPAMVDPAYNWSGFYAGVNLGGTWNNGSVSSVGTGTPVAAGAGPIAIASALASVSTYNLSNRGGSFMGGGQIGYNWRVGTFVTGVEADIQSLGGSRSSFLTSVTPVPGFPAESYTAAISAAKNLSYLGTLRARAGITAFPNLLLYGTAGLAYGQASVSNSIVAADPVGGYAAPASGFGSTSSTRAGWTAGVGGEWMFASNWSAKAEYLYYNLGTLRGSNVVTQFNPAPLVWAMSTNTTSTRIDGNIVRVGVNYHFSGPMAGKY